MKLAILWPFGTFVKVDSASFLANQHDDPLNSALPVCGALAFSTWRTNSLRCDGASASKASRRFAFLRASFKSSGAGVMRGSTSSSSRTSTSSPALRPDASQLFAETDHKATSHGRHSGSVRVSINGDVHRALLAGAQRFHYFGRYDNARYVLIFPLLNLVLNVCDMF